jgi:adenosylcobinamide-GDP ribazoletransferase
MGVLNFLSAIGFLTILPVPSSARIFDGKQVVYFPLVGLLIGGMLWAVDWGFSCFASSEIRVIGDVLFLAIITGALHLDGLADSADGLFSHRSREQVLEIMKDSRIGVMGVLALIFCLLFKMGGIAGIKNPVSSLWFIIIPALSRTAQVLGLTLIEHVKPQSALATNFYQRNNWSTLLFCPVPFALIFYLDFIMGTIALVAFSILIFGLFYFYKKMIGGITGDTIGATTEIVEAFFFIFAGVTASFL